MTLDLALLGLIGFFALLGAITGASRQVAQLVGMAAALLFARPVGAFVGPYLAQLLKLPLLVSSLAATMAAFALVLLGVRSAVTYGVQRLLGGNNPEERRLDRALGFAFGGLKVAFMAYVVLCALAFVEDNVAFGGQRLHLTAPHSTAFSLARRYNLFETAKLGAVSDLVGIAQAAGDPKQAKRLAQSPAYQALRKDPRFKAALESDSVRKALESGDYGALLKSAAVQQLLEDSATVERLSAAAKAGSTSP